MSNKKRKKRGGNENVHKQQFDKREEEEVTKKEEVAEEVVTESVQKKEEKKVEVTASEGKKEEEIKGQGLLAEIDEETEGKKTIKNLISAVIVLAGVAVGSLFIDIVQFVSGNGYSERGLRDERVFVQGDKTWVAFSDPIVNVKVLTVGKEELEECQNCDPQEILLWLKDFIPTMNAESVEVDSKEGEEMIEKFGIKAIPAFVFSGDIEETKFFAGEGRVVFEEKEEDYLLNSVGLGIPVGKYLATPEITETDAVLGNRDAKAKVVVFSDFQCPYCEEYFKSVKKTVESYDPNEVALVYKDLPLNFHAQGKNSALVARCAQDQDKFWEMAEILYSTQKEWQDSTGTTAFTRYARQVGLNLVDYNKCVTEKTFEAVIEEDMEQAKELGVSGTPATFVGENFASGVVSGDELRIMIEAQLNSEDENELELGEVEVKGAKDEADLVQEEIENIKIVD